MNTDLFRHLLSRSKDCDNHYSGFTYSGLLGDILRSDLEEIFKEWEKYTDIEFCQQGKTKVPPWIRYTAAYVINTTSGNTGRETLLITLWEKTGVFKSLDLAYHGSALLSVAAATCSVKLAKCLVDYGADINFRRSELYLTALHHAARQTSAAAADMIKYLLL